MAEGHLTYGYSLNEIVARLGLRQTTVGKVISQAQSRA